MSLNNKEIVKTFKALCDENRVKIIENLVDGEMCACKLLEKLNIAQATLSQHMKILCDSLLVEYRKEGKWMHYTLSKDGFNRAIKILKELGRIK